ncbi:MAG: hypothetical protein MH112_11220 [Phenylobacterium sp.]|uniref:hypothetical protein n=1 Tax=Phenylobacterium sp. TaxID=1871053 RepID=UPI0025D9C54D|nr:hypothetical protein [Phenylobacterium sp.]MCG9916909.1 hypothetical protein [Phenylobacterium sp.]
MTDKPVPLLDRLGDLRDFLKAAREHEEAQPMVTADDLETFDEHIATVDDACEALSP